jgi:hypothetical protein
MTRDYGQDTGWKRRSRYRVGKVEGLDFPSYGMKVEVRREFGRMTIRVGTEVVFQGELSDGKCSGAYYQDGRRFELTLDAERGRLQCDVFYDSPISEGDPKEGTWTADEDGG